MRFKPLPAPELPPLDNVLEACSDATGFDSAKASEAIDEIARVDTRLDNRLNGLLTGTAFIAAVASLLLVVPMRIPSGLFLIPIAAAVGSGYLVLTAQQYPVERTPVRPADEYAVRAAYDAHSLRLSGARTATWALGFAFGFLVLLAVFGGPR